MKKDASSPPLTEEERRLVEIYGELVRFPVAGDRFFADAGPALVDIDPNYSRRIFKNPGDPNFLLFKEYARAYEEAVEELCLAVFRHPELRRKLVFPIITCVHQHLELLLKLVLFHLTSEFTKGHKLLPIWSEVIKSRPDLKWGPPGTAEQVSRLLLEFDRVTGTGFGGRYPFELGRVTYLSSLDAVDVLNLRARLGNLSHYLSQILHGLELESGFE